MQELNFLVDNFDQDNTFCFAYEGRNGEVQAKGYLLDCKDDGIFIMKKSACLKDKYTEKDIEENNRIYSMQPLRTDTEVKVQGKVFKVKILGNYSDAGRLIAV